VKQPSLERASLRSTVKEKYNTAHQQRVTHFPVPFRGCREAQIAVVGQRQQGMEAFAAQLPQLEVLAERLYNSTVR